jgi:hypothetical protein
MLLKAAIVVCGVRYVGRKQLHPLNVTNIVSKLLVEGASGLRWEAATRKAAYSSVHPALKTE